MARVMPGGGREQTSESGGEDCSKSWSTSQGRAGSLGIVLRGCLYKRGQLKRSKPAVSHVKHQRKKTQRIPYQMANHEKGREMAVSIPPGRCPLHKGGVLK